MPMELHHFNDEVPGSSPGGSNMRSHSSMVEHAVSSKPCRRALRGYSPTATMLTQRPLDVPQRHANQAKRGRYAAHARTFF